MIAIYILLNSDTKHASHRLEKNGYSVYLYGRNQNYKEYKFLMCMERELLMVISLAKLKW
jgi:hypothetical protein